MSEENQTPAQPKKKFAELTKDEKIAFLRGQLAALNQKLDDTINDVVRAPKAKAAAVLPTPGQEVLFLYGRRTNTTEPTEKVGTVLAVKPETTIEVGGKPKKAPAQIKVQIGSGFDVEIVVIYPGAIKHIVSAELTAAANPQ